MNHVNPPVSRYYEEFKIDRTSGESNLTQMYLLVSLGSPVLSKAVSISDDTTLSVEQSMLSTPNMCFTVSFVK